MIGKMIVTTKFSVSKLVEYNDPTAMRNAPFGVC